MDDGKFTKVKKFLAFVFGCAVLWASIIFSKNGFEFKTTVEYGWIGWTLAFAATVSQFMMNSSFKKINWTILVLGIVSYVYSIYTNMLGFHSLRETESIWNVLNVCGSFFMDVFPEVAIAWSLDESKVGDLFGNLLKSSQNPELLSTTQEIIKKISGSGGGNNNQNHSSQSQSHNNGQSQRPINNGSTQNQSRGNGQPQYSQQRPIQSNMQSNQNNRPAPKPSYDRTEPTYHPISMQSQMTQEEIERLMKLAE